MKRTEVAFLAALIGSPLLLAGAGFLANFQGDGGAILVGAAAIGLPSYFFVGAPFLLYGVGRGWRLVPIYALLGFLANLAATPLFGLAVLTTSGRPDEMIDAMKFVGGLGLFFAPLFGLLFGLIFWLGTRSGRNAPPAWTTSPPALVRIVAAQIAAPYLIAILSLLGWLWLGAGLRDWWGDALKLMLPIAVVSVPVFYGLRLFGLRSTPLYALAGALITPLAAITTAFDYPAETYHVTLAGLAAAALNLPMIHWLAGSPKEPAK